MTSNLRITFFVGFIGLLANFAYGGAHTWRIKEVYSNASGSIQFIELVETCGGAGETALSGHQVKSVANTVNLVNLVSSSSNKHLLFGTSNLTTYGGPAPDYIIPANFFSLTGDTLQYTPYHSCAISSGSVPTDGTNSLNRAAACVGTTCPTTMATNSPTNFAGATGTVSPPVCIDTDSDGYGSPGDASCPNGSATDCNNGNNAIHPGAVEDCDDTIDNDCDTDTDCDDSACSSLPLCTGVPTVSEWGLVVIALLLLSCGTVISRVRTRSVA